MSNQFTLRRPQLDDGPQLHQLIRECPPLDLNSAYAYHLIGMHFGSTSIVAEATTDGAEKTLAAAVTGYRLPDEANTLFIWQVAVHQSARGQGLALRLLQQLLHDLPWVQTMHTTISPSNLASHALFARLAERQGAQLFRRPAIAADACGSGHEAEELIILDFTTPPNKGEI